MPKRSFQPKKRHAKRVSGFFARMKTRAGRAIVSRRRQKGRHKLTSV